jgi:hypothetical protein
VCLAWSAQGLGNEVIRLEQTIPALAVRDTRAAVALYRASELQRSDVLHPVPRNRVDTTDFGTREFATLDLDGNLLTFHRPSE